MKNLFLLPGAFIIICLTMNSCKKDYVCRCTKTYTSGTGTNVPDYALYPYTDTKRKAEERCSTNNLTSGDFDGAYDIQCQIQ